MRRWSRFEPPKPPIGYIAAVLLVAAAVVLRLPLQSLLGTSVPFMLFFPAVVIAAWFGGFGPGLLAVTLSALTAAFWLLPPTFRVTVQEGRASLVLFVIVSAFISWIASRLSAAELEVHEAHERVQQHADEALGAEETRQRLGAIVESSDDAIVGMDLVGTITSWNRAAERMFGYPAAEAVGRSIRLIIPPERWAEEDDVLARIRTGERVEHFETVRVHRSGDRIDMSITFSPIKNRDGIIVGASKVGRNITDRRRAERAREEALQREQAARADAVAARDRLAFLTEAGDLLASSLDYEETLRRAAGAAVPRLGDYCNILLLEEAGAVKHVAWAHVDPQKEPILRQLAQHAVQVPGWRSFASRVLESGRRFRWDRNEHDVAALEEGADATIISLSAALAPFAYVGVPLKVSGRTVGVMSFATTMADSGRVYSDADVELLEEFARRASLAIENARLFARAEELNRLKDEFLATLSHELRTPLSAILGWARMLRQGQVAGDAQLRALESIERNALSQSRIVEDILDVARGMTGNLRLDLAPLNLVDVTRRALEAIAPAAAAKQLAVDVHGDTPVWVDGDAVRLQQVIWNLLSNAVKFTPAGGRVTLTVARRDHSGIVTVADTGIGISPAFLPVMFDKFRQQDQSFTREYGGLGLGLAIVRQLVELHGGSIEADSAGKGHGARFTVSLPLSVREASTA